jgi:hypothetical protein
MFSDVDGVELRRKKFNFVNVALVISFEEEK